MSRVTTRPKREIEYPESDGKPMAETDVHRNWMVWNIQRLSWHFRGQRVYVSGNLLVYYVEGDPTKSFAPDTFVVKNCRPGQRRTFKIWEEKKVPSFILETTSKKTKREDEDFKKKLYQKLRIKEYFLYDPLAEWLDPPLQGFRLVGDRLLAIDPESDGGLVSRELGLKLMLVDGRLEMFDLRTGERLLTDGERADQASHEAEDARRHAQLLEQELARLRAKQGNGQSGRRNGGKS